MIANDPIYRNPNFVRVFEALSRQSFQLSASDLREFDRLLQSASISTAFAECLGLELISQISTGQSNAVQTILNGMRCVQNNPDAIYQFFVQNGLTPRTRELDEQ